MILVCTACSGTCTLILRVAKTHHIYSALRQGYSPELQIREGTEDNSKIFFLFLKENICCDLSLELSRQEGCNDGSQNMFLWRNIANYLFLSAGLISSLE